MKIQQSTNYTIPLNIDRAVIEVNGGCNYTCAMCPQTFENGTTGARGKNWLKKMSLEDFEKVISESSSHGLRVVNLEGSGEPTLNRNLDEYIKIVRKYNAAPFIYTNGFLLRGDFMKRVVDSGLALARFSCIGYDKETYKKWMNRDAFDIIKRNISDMMDYIAKTDSKTIVASYHLILNEKPEEEELELYRKNFIDELNTYAEVWRMHNWSGVYGDVERKGNRRTCGRPFAPELTVRAGAADGTKLSLAPCCQTLGRDDEADLGTLVNNTLEEVWNGKKYQELRKAHAEKRFDDISFCKDCDFLIDDPEVLVWKNNDMVQLNKLKGTQFTLDDFM